MWRQYVTIVRYGASGSSVRIADPGRRLWTSGRSMTTCDAVSWALGLRARQGHDPQGGRNSSGATPWKG